MGGTIVTIIVVVVVLFVFLNILKSVMARSTRDTGLTDQVSHGFIYVIQQQHCGVIERLGKFHHIVDSGLHVCIPIIDRVRDVSMMTEDNHMTFDAKTKDNVTIELDVSIQYHVDFTRTQRVDESGIYRSLYTLTDPVSQMRDYFADALRSQIPTRTLDEVFEEKDAIASAIEQDVAEKMRDYGYQVVTTLITSIRLPQDVQISMNRIIATKNDLESAKNEANAAKQKTVIAAQAEAESMKLAGEGIANQRIAIAEGLAKSMDTIKESGLTTSEANALLMFTQNIDMMEQFAKQGRATTVVLPADMASGSDIFSQVVAAGKTLESERNMLPYESQKVHAAQAAQSTQMRIAPSQAKAQPSQASPQVRAQYDQQRPQAQQRKNL